MTRASGDGGRAGAGGGVGDRAPGAVEDRGGTHGRGSSSLSAAGGQLVVAPTDAEHAGEKFKPIDKEVSRRLLRYMFRYPRLQWWIIGLAVVIAAVHALTPYVITETIRWSIEDPERWRSLTGLEPMWGVATGSAILLLMGVVFYAVMRVRIMSVNRMAERVMFDLRKDLFGHVQRLDMAFFDRTKLGWILARLTSDVTAVRQAVAEVIPRTLIHALMMVGLLGIMVSYDWVLASVIAGLGPVLWVVNNFFRRRMGEAYREVRASFSRLTANLAEAVSGMRVTQAFGREPINAEMFRELCLSHRSKNMRAARVHGTYIPTFELTSQLVAAVIVGLGGWRVATGRMDVSDLIGFLLCTGGFFISIVILAELYNTTLQAMAGGERMFGLLDTEPRISDRDDARELPRAPGGVRVRFEGVSFGYDPETPVLHDVSFEAEPGRVLALVGATGSGKTSIVSLIARLYAHQRGLVEIDGEPVGAWTLRSLRRQVGLVLQDNFLFTGTVLDNIRFGRPDASDEEVRAACERLGCLDVLLALPEGLDTEVGERGSNLSLGQRQLACFARAMLEDPRLLMLDEATSAVDTFTEYRIQRALETLMKGRTSIVVAHRLSTVRRADQILVLEHGRIIERGRHGELVSLGGKYSELYREFVRLSSE